MPTDAVRVERILEDVAEDRLSTVECALLNAIEYPTERVRLIREAREELARIGAELQEAVTLAARGYPT